MVDSHKSRVAKPAGIFCAVAQEVVWIVVARERREEETRLCVSIGPENISTPSSVRLCPPSWPWNRRAVRRYRWRTTDPRQKAGDKLGFEHVVIGKLILRYAIDKTVSRLSLSNGRAVPLDGGLVLSSTSWVIELLGCQRAAYRYFMLSKA